MKTFSFLILFLVLMSSCKFVYKRPFNKEEWNENPKERYKMVDDLVKSKILIGKNKKEIKEVLSSDCKYCDKNSNYWMYYLGEGFNKKDFKWKVLDIEFKNEKVINITVRE